MAVLAEQQSKSSGTEGQHRTNPPVRPHNSSSTHIIALGLEDVEEQSDAILCGSNELPDAVLIWRILSRPPRAGDRSIQLGDKTPTSSWTEENNSKTLVKYFKEIRNIVLPIKHQWYFSVYQLFQLPPDKNTLKQYQRSVSIYAALNCIHVFSLLFISLRSV